MIKNYFKIAFRNLLRNKAFTVINITGLAIGLTCCMLMVLYLQHEMSFDKFHDKSDRIVRVIMEYKFGSSELSKGNYTSTKVFPSFKRNFPEVEDGVRMTSTTQLVKYGDKIFNERKFLFADSTFFNLFSFNLIEGKPGEVLKGPKMVVITKSAAKKYFGNESPVGKSLLLGSQQVNYQVTGVMADCPSNSQLSFDFLASFSSFGPAQEETYWDANFTTYLLLKDKKAIASLQSKIPGFMKKEMSEEPDTYLSYELEPLTRVHLYSKFDAITPNINITYIYIIAGIVLLVLTIACFTYINLSTARSMERAKEVGIRKVSGAYRTQVFWQFISESLLVTFIALLVSIAATWLVLPAFNQLLKTRLLISGISKFQFIAIAASLMLVIALLAGSYPALVLSKFIPVKVLKGSFKNAASGIWLRKSLIVFQFVVSVFLIIATFVVSGQLKYIQNKKLGYDREHVLITKIDQKIIDKIDLLKTELKSNPEIIAVSKAYESPVQINGGYSMNETGSDKTFSVTANPVDDEYIKVNGMELIAGSNLSQQDGLDASKEDYTKNYYHFILNEKAVATLGWTASEAIGKKIMLGERRPGEIKGVVKDFHFASLHSPVEPLILFPGEWGNTLLVKTSGRNLQQTINFISGKCKAIAPYRPFEYRFMDEDYQKLYDSEMRTGKVFNIFSAIAILLACLGLFGLSAYAAKQRIKEIGVRKVLGASAGHITLLLSGNFLKLVLIAFVIACPVAWWAANKWLQGFAYRVNVNWWVFAVAGVLSVLIAFITVSFQSIRAALNNPVKSLRTE